MFSLEKSEKTMNATPEEIALLWREQMKRGYLKLSILFVLTNGSLHGYKIGKRIKEFTLGLLTPTAGAIYPTLKELEKDHLVKGEWKNGEKRRVKIYEITERGREVFRKAVEKHFNTISVTETLILKELENLKIIQKVGSQPQILMQTMRVLLLKEKASLQEKIDALEKLKTGCYNLKKTLTTIIFNIDERVRELQDLSAKNEK